jgi:hypothetical protein
MKTLPFHPKLSCEQSKTKKTSFTIAKSKGSKHPPLLPPRAVLAARLSVLTANAPATWPTSASNWEVKWKAIAWMMHATLNVLPPLACLTADNCSKITTVLLLPTSP